MKLYNTRNVEILPADNRYFVIEILDLMKKFPPSTMYKGKIRGLLRERP